jgi:polysaccharide transporter, PST family
MPFTGRLGKNILALSVLQLMNYAVPLITVPYLARVLGPERFGLLAFAQALIIYFDLITDYGFNLSATRRIAECRHDRLNLARVFWSTLTTKVFLMLACALAMGLIVYTIPRFRPHAPLYAAAFLTVVGTAIFPTWLFQGLEQMKFLAIGFAVARLSSVPLLVWAVRSSNDYVRAAAIQGAVPIVAAAIVMPLIWTRIGVAFHRPSSSDVLKSLKDGWHLFVSNTGMYLCTSTVVVLLGLVAGDVQVGYYSAADKLIKAASSMINPLTQALYPHLNSQRASARESILPLIRKTLLWVGAATFAGSLGIVVFAGPIGGLLFGAKFGPSVLVLRCMAPLLFLLGLNNILSTQTMMVFGMDQRVSRIILISALATGLLTLWLAHGWGAPGAAVATVSGALLMTVQIVRALKAAKLTVWKQQKEPVCVS